MGPNPALTVDQEICTAEGRAHVTSQGRVETQMPGTQRLQPRQEGPLPSLVAEACGMDSRLGNEDPGQPGDSFLPEPRFPQPCPGEVSPPPTCPDVRAVGLFGGTLRTGIE